jgi:hypothetical protein
LKTLLKGSSKPSGQQHAQKGTACPRRSSMPRREPHAPEEAACPEGNNMPQRKQDAQKGTTCPRGSRMPRREQHAPEEAACPGGAPKLGGSSMPRGSGIKGLLIAPFHEIEDKLVSGFKSK